MNDSLIEDRALAEAVLGRYRTAQGRRSAWGSPDQADEDVSFAQ